MSGSLTEDVAAPVAGPRGHASGRLARLAKKELRETLRDRRTLVTLVLMPFLLYPLLSMVLQKFLLAGAIAGTTPVYHLGLYSENDASFVDLVLSQGRRFLAGR